MDEASGRSGRGRCEEHDLARGPDGRCVLCRRDETPPAPRSKVHRAVVLVGVLTTLFGGVAFARGVVASRAAHVAPPPPVFEARETTAPHPPPPIETEHQNPDPVAPPAPSTTTNHRLDDALATVTPERPVVKPEPKIEVAETPTVADGPCVCRPRVAHMVNRPYNAWGSDHDSEGHLAVKSRLHAAWGPPLSFNETTKCACPRGTVRVHPHPQAPTSTTTTDHISPG